jgi:hypothetical protein
MKNIHTLLFIGLIILTACEGTELGEVLPARAIVEAIMPAGQPMEIHVSKEILFKREEADSIFDLAGLVVTVNDGHEEFTLIDEGNGNYTSDKIVDITKSYAISFEFNGIKIGSETTVPTKPQLFTASTTEMIIQPFTGGRPPTGLSATLDLSWSNQDGSSYLVVVENIENNPTQINSSGFARPSFRSEPLVSDSYQVRANQFQYYGMHAVILFKVNPDYAALYEDPGDNSLTIKSPFTNVKNGLGIFTAVNSDTMYLNVRQ